MALMIGPDSATSDTWTMAQLVQAGRSGTGLIHFLKPNDLRTSACGITVHDDLSWSVPTHSASERDAQRFARSPWCSACRAVVSVRPSRRRRV